MKLLMCNKCFQYVKIKRDESVLNPFLCNSCLPLVDQKKTRNIELTEEQREALLQKYHYYRSPEFLISESNAAVAHDYIHGMVDTLRALGLDINDVLQEKAEVSVQDVKFMCQVRRIEEAVSFINMHFQEDNKLSNIEIEIKTEPSCMARGYNEPESLYTVSLLKKKREIKW